MYVLWQNEKTWSEDPVGCTQSNLHKTFIFCSVCVFLWHIKEDTSKTNLTEDFVPSKKICSRKDLCDNLFSRFIFLSFATFSQCHKELFKAINQNYVVDEFFFLRCENKRFIHANLVLQTHIECEGNEANCRQIWWKEIRTIYSPF